MTWHIFRDTDIKKTDYVVLSSERSLCLVIRYTQAALVYVELNFRDNCLGRGTSDRPITREEAAFFRQIVLDAAPSFDTSPKVTSFLSLIASLLS